MAVPTLQSSVPATMRNCSAKFSISAPAAPGPPPRLSLSNYTGRILNAATGVTEALLIVGDPSAPALGSNVYQGTLVAPNAVRFNNVVLPFPGTAKLPIRIVNLRADTGTTFLPNLSVPTPILAFTDGGSVPFARPELPVGYISRTHRFQIQNAAGNPVSSMDFNGVSSSWFTFRFDEAAPNSFRKRNIATSFDNASALAPQAEYGRNYGTESGFYLPALNANDAGLASHGTRLMVTFSNVPDGVTLNARLAAAAGSSSSIQVRLISTAADGSGVFAPTVPNGELATVLPVSGGVARGVWEIVESDPAVLETLQLLVLTTSTSASIGKVGVSGQLAPISAANTADVTSSIPRFTVPSVPVPACGANCLSVSSALTLSYTIGASAPAPISIPVRSTNTPLSFQAVVTTGGSFPGAVVPPDAPWITLAPSSGVTPANLTATINPAGLVPGYYPALITVTAGRFSERINVVLRVKANAAAPVVPTCDWNSGVPPIVRATGMTEMMSDLVANCPAGAAGVTTDLRLTLNTTLTSRPNDLLLLVNDPAPLDQSLGTTVFRGERVSDTQAVFRSVFLPPAPDPSISSYNFLRITNAFADVSRLGLSATAIPTQARSILRLSNLAASGSEQAAAFVLPGHTFSLLSAGGTSAANLAAAGPSGKLRFTEGYASAFRRRNAATTFATPNALTSQRIPGAIYNTETGFYNPSLPNAGGIDMGLATQGTRLIARFNNIPAGMGISVSVNELGAASPKAQLTQTDANGAGPFLAVAGPFAPVTITAGSGIAVWELLNVDPLSVETLEFALQLTGTVPSTATADGLLGPLSTVNTANPSAPLPRFAAANAANPVCPSFPCLRGPSSVSLTSNGTALALAIVPISSDADPVPFTVDDPTVPWLTLQSAAGVTPGQFTIVANPAGLAAGTYSTTLNVNSVAIPVTFNVLSTGPNALLLPVERMQISFSEGATPAPPSFTLTGTPGLAWTVTSSLPWLTLSAPNGTVPATLTVYLLGTNLLPAGEYDGLLTFTAAGAAPVNLLVHVSIGPYAGTFTISGTIASPASGPRANITVNLTGAATRTTTSAADGSYAFTGLTSSGPYTVTPVPAGYTFSPAKFDFATVPPSQLANFSIATIASPPTLVSFLPTNPTGTTQSLQFQVQDLDGVANLARIYFLIADSLTPANTCHGYYDRAANAVFLYNDAVTAASNTVLSNTQCQVGATATGLNATNLALLLPVTLKGAFAAAPHNVYLWITDNDGNGTGWLSISTWRPTGNSAPSFTSAAALPNNNGIRFLAADVDNNLSRAYFVVNTAPTVQPNGCHGYYDYARGAAFLYDDALATLLGPLAPGAAATLENSSCSIDGAQLAVALNGEVTLPIYRKGAAVTITQTVYLWITDTLGLGTGWVDRGVVLPQRTNLPPVITNGAPVSAPAGSTQTFTARIDDPDSPADITRVYFLLNSNTSISQNTCHGYYDRASGTTFLYNDALTAASSTNLENSQCRINSITVAGGTTLSLNILRKTTTALNLYLWAVDASANGTGWVQTSTWPGASNTPPTVVAPTIPALTGTPQTFTFTARDVDGASDLRRLYFLINPTTTIPANTCHGYYDKLSNAIYLYSDGLATPLGPLTGTLQNSQCAVSGATISNTATDITLTLNVTIKTGIATNAYLWAVDSQSIGTGWVQTASWSSAVANRPPTIVTAPPIAMTGNSGTLPLTARDLDGYADIQRLYFLIAPTTNITANSCHGYYDRAANAIFLYNDALTVLALTPQNSQCAVNPATSSVASSLDGQNLIVNAAMSLSSGYNAALQNIYLWAVDSQNNGTGWVQAGQWQSSSASNPPTVSAATAQTLTATSRRFVAPVADLDGKSNIDRIYFLLSNTNSPTANSCHGYYDRLADQVFLYNDALNALVPSASAGNSQCAVSTPSGVTPFAPVTATSGNLTLTFNAAGSYVNLAGKNLYLYAVDQQNNGTGWVQVASWN